MVLLGVNIDHVATVRQARRCREPDPVRAAVEAEIGGADQITIHLREDRRHIQDRDLRLLRETVRTRLNLEMALSDDITRIAQDVRPDQATIVPEKREEITTEGGIDAVLHAARSKEIASRLAASGITVSFFIDPEPAQVRASAAAGATFVELHTGAYANAAHGAEREFEAQRLHAAARLARQIGLGVNAGHGLDYGNLEPIIAIPGLHEVNIGHSIVSHAIFVGLREAVRQMRERIREIESSLPERT